jgi:hypothetical protein
VDVYKIARCGEDNVSQAILKLLYVLWFKKSLFTKDPVE